MLSRRLAVPLSLLTSLLVVILLLTAIRLNAAWAALNPPAILGVDPSTAASDLDTPITITGLDFMAELSGTQVLTNPLVQLGAILLPDAGWINSTTLTATVPWGLDPGVYPLTVTNPDGQSASLTEAFTVTQGFNVWSSAGPYGGSLTGLQVDSSDPNTLFATLEAANSATGIGLFRSRDAGGHWALILPDIHNHFHAAALSKAAAGLVYAQQKGVGLYRSSDYGDTWTVLPTPQDNRTDTSFYPHPTDPQVVYAGVFCGPACGGLYRSTDQGAQWVELTAGLTDRDVTALTFDPLDSQILYAGTSSGNVFRSTNSGEAWSWIGKPDFFISNLAVNPFGDREVWACGADNSGHWGYLWKRTATGWERILGDQSAGIMVGQLAFHPAMPGTLYAATQNGQVSSDGGETWSSLGSPFMGNIVVALDPTNPQTIYLGYGGDGIAKTTNAGASWAEINQGLAGIYPTGLAMHPTDPARVFATAHGTGVFLTNNGGGAWLRLPASNTFPRSPVVDPNRPDRVYVLGTNSVDWSEAGSAWERTYPPAPPQWAGCCQVAVHALVATGQPGRLIVGGYFIDTSSPQGKVVAGGLWRSTDWGESWSDIALSQEISPVASLAAVPGNPAVIYAGTGDQGKGTGVWKSEDGGDGWQQSGLEGLHVLALAVNPSDTQIVYALANNDFYVSPDRGATWALTQRGDFSGMDHLLVLDTRPVTIYRYGYNGVVRSLDGGQRWTRLAGSLGTAKVGSMAGQVLDGRAIVYIGTAGSTTSASSRLRALEAAALAPGVYRSSEALLPPRSYLPLIRR